MKIIHFSDPHEGGKVEHWTGFFDKRILGSINYMKRRKSLDSGLLSNAVQLILDQKPDLAICTGDITSCGQPGEFKRAIKYLEPLVQSKVPFIYMPGNHDAYVKNRYCAEALAEAFTYLNRNAFTLDDLPVSVVYGGCEIILINASRPTSAVSSCGYFARNTGRFLNNICSAQKRFPRIIAGHFPLIERHPILRFRRRLWGQAQALKCLKDGIIDLSLCGHVHMPYAILDSRGRGEICAGSVTKSGCVSVIEYDPSTDIFSHRSISLR